MQENTEQMFRQVMRGYPTGVTIVTSLSEGKPVGGTMNSFTISSRKEANLFRCGRNCDTLIY